MKIVNALMFDGPQRAGTKFDLTSQLNEAWLLCQILHQAWFYACNDSCKISLQLTKLR